MTSILKQIEPESNPIYEVIMGSHAYGCATPTSDMDIYACIMPDVQSVFPKDYIHGFDPEIVVESRQWPHVMLDGKSYDINIYSIVKYFKMLMNCNPNILDSLYVPDLCVIYSTELGQRIRDNRHLFLSKRLYGAFRGYVQSQIKKLQPQDLKAQYHAVRLCVECKQLLSEGTMSLDKYSAIYIDIRAGRVSFEQVQNLIKTQDSLLKSLFEKTDLPPEPDIKAIRDLLMEILNDYYKEKVC